MRVVLVNPLVPSGLQRHRLDGAAHLGLAYVAAALMKRGHEVHLVDAKTERLNLPQIVARIKQYEPRIVGSTAMTHEICYVGELFTAVKEVCLQCVTMVGGPHSTALPERTIHEFPAIDVAVSGEGEETACELADAVESSARRYEWQSILGIAYRDSGEVHRTAPRPWIGNLDSLPMPAWELFPPNIPWPVFASRGCPFRCAFCQRVLGSKVRLRSVDNVLAEFDELERRLGKKGTWFQDETFGVNRPWMDEFLDKLNRRNERRGDKWSWGCNSRVNLASPDVYLRMKEAGCNTVGFGIESGDQTILDRIHKGIRLDNVREALRFAKEAGLRVDAFFIIGHPGETWRSALRTVQFAPLCGADSIAVGIMVPYPGTEIWDLAKKGECGYRLLTEDWRAYDKYFGSALELQSLSRRKLEFLQALTYLWFYVRRGRFGDLLRFVRRFSKDAMAFLWKMLFSARRSNV